MIESLMLLKAAACAGIFWRTYTYEWPSEAKVKWGVTTIAYVLMFIAGAQAICVVLGSHRVAILLDTLFYMCVLLLVLLAKGNIADIIRVKWESSWDGEERRRHD